MPEPDSATTEFYARARRHADADGRLPLPEQSMWEIFPFERDGLRTRPLESPVLPEPPRAGEAGSDCQRCADPDSAAVWSDERWVLSRFTEALGLPFGAILAPRAHLDLGDLDEDYASELGRLIVRVDRAARLLPGLGRLHVNKWGDGGAHLHIVLLGRPAGLLQLRGSNLPMWEEMLPRVPEEEALAALTAVAGALASSGGHAHL